MTDPTPEQLAICWILARAKRDPQAKPPRKRRRLASVRRPR